jgi:uncharacterized Zn finger protein (UPF0148 family)
MGPPACTACGSPLAPNGKFCNICGTPVPQVKVPVNAWSEVMKPPMPETPSRQPVNIPVSQESEKTRVISVALSSPFPGNTTLAKSTSSSSHKKAAAGIIILLLVVALTWFVIMPMVPGSMEHLTGNEAINRASDLGTISLTLVPTIVVPTTITTTAVTPAPSSPQFSLVPGPVRFPPSDLMIYTRVEKDLVYDGVTVTFEGGPGQTVVKDILFRLIRSDGQVLESTIMPDKNNEATLQGTRKADRVEVIAIYDSGQQYTLIDELIEDQITE